jgi:hypothetical protein
MLKPFRLFSAGLFTLVVAHGAMAQSAPGNGAKSAATATTVHHLGLKGQTSPHNGWGSYGHLTMDLGADRYFVYDQGAGEFSATVIDRQSETVKIRVISIPGAGLFYFPAEASLCMAEPVERLGLYAELLLFYLSAAAPTGPASFEGPLSVVVDEPVPELQFMQGVMKARQGARTLVTISRADRKLRYVLHDDKDNVKGEWEAGRDYGVIPDNESLIGWRSCWTGNWSKTSGGKSSFEANLDNSEAFKTFGDVRRALRRKQGSKTR